MLIIQFNFSKYLLIDCIIVESFIKVQHYGLEITITTLIILLQVSVSGNELCLMTSHLESTRGHAEERMNQLKMVLKKMQEAPESATVIFAGDTNLRDQEVSDDVTSVYGQIIALETNLVSFD